MARITDPLSRMGASFEFLEEPGRLPVRVTGGGLRPFSYQLPVASAQLKSALLLAGLVGGVEVDLTEPGRSRDHTERMLVGLGVDLRSGSGPAGWEVSLGRPPSSLPALDLDVPGDFSSAAFLILLGLLAPEGNTLVVRSVGLNDTRTGLLGVLEQMGARVEVEMRPGGSAGEPIGDLVVHGTRLSACRVGGAEMPRFIDEVPILAVGAARAEGVTRIEGAAELRVKETDRIGALVTNLRALGVEVEELEDGLEIQGSDMPLVGTVQSFGDHRIAMAFGVLGALPGNEIEIEGSDTASVSFPGFWEMLSQVKASLFGVTRSGGKTSSSGGEARSAQEDAPVTGPLHRERPIVTLDGPAGSGKSTTAREIARRLGFRHLDSGALYRALTYALMSSGVPEEEWPRLPLEELDRFRIWLDPDGGRFKVMLGDQVLDQELRTPEVTALVSPLSALPAVRAWLLEAQRRAGSEGGLVADGRDMGTVVFPDAEVKIFLTADLRERARRRFLERTGRPPSRQEVSQEAQKIRERDERDSGRAVAPLRKAQTAIEVDTSELTFEAQVEVIIRHVKALTKE